MVSQAIVIQNYWGGMLERRAQLERGRTEAMERFNVLYQHGSALCGGMLEAVSAKAETGASHIPQGEQIPTAPSRQ